MEENKKIKIAEIAEDAGVSLATVSRVINQKGNVKKDTLEKVIASIKKLGYEIDTSANPLSPEPAVIIFNLPSIANPFYSEIVRGAKMSAERHGYELLINEGHINPDTLPKIISIVRKTKAAGIITANQIQSSTLKHLNDIVPVVQCCEFNEYFDIPFVTIDDVQASIEVVEYLHSLGRKRIAFINGPQNYKYARKRFLGYQKGLEKVGLPYDSKLVVNLPNIQYDLATSATMQLINTDNPPDAFFACSDVFAFSILRSAKLCGYNIPEDFLVVGFDNIDITAASYPSITTVGQPQTQMGFTSGELLVEKIENPNAPSKKVFLETELIIRESTKFM